ncbi:MAG: hypothetical protein E7647_06660 [Ruminococcaceae bacterium]|nr:hypothetical protein [Oscillospiraceae bacterium]
MNKVTKILLLVLAAALIIGGIVAAVLAITNESDKAKKPSADGSDTTLAPHDEVEYIYDEKGNVKSEIYYKDNVYIGQRDYFQDGNKEYITVFDKDRREIESSLLEKNVAGSVIKITTYKYHLLSEIVEYDYYYDLITPEKKTVKTYVGNDVYAEKTYYSENGKKTRQCSFLNDELLEDVYYDEFGKIIENGGETVEE